MNSVSCHRRTFLQKSISFLALILFWPVRKVASATSVAHAEPAGNIPDVKQTGVVDGPSSSAVAAAACETYDPETVFNAVSRALAGIGFSVPRGIRILIKPNIIGQNSPGQAATTHPSVVEALCRIFKAAQCSITIGDSSAFYQGGGTLKGMQTAGMVAVAEKYGVRILPFEKASIRKITAGKVLNPFWITEAVFEHDLVVDVPKLKVHRLARYTGAIKNMYGCIPGGTKQTYHEKVQNRPDYKEFWGGPVVDVYTAAHPGLVVMDAVYGLDKDGPAANGKPRLTGVILASTNGAMLDVAACKMVGFDPRWVPAVRVALERGLADEKNLKVIGNLPQVPYVKLPDQKPSKTGDYLFHQVIMKPVVHRSRCGKGRSSLVKICKPGAISLDSKGVPVIDYEVCIRCYCCAEQCTGKEITLQGGVLNHTIRMARKIAKI